VGGGTISLVAKEAFLVHSNSFGRLAGRSQIRTCGMIACDYPFVSMGVVHHQLTGSIRFCGVLQLNVHLQSNGRTS
jgi:hypothetical protein